MGQATVRRDQRSAGRSMRQAACAPVPAWLAHLHAFPLPCLRACQAVPAQCSRRTPFHLFLLPISRLCACTATPPCIPLRTVDANGPQGAARGSSAQLLPSHDHPAPRPRLVAHSSQVMRRQPSLPSLVPVFTGSVRFCPSACPSLLTLARLLRRSAQDRQRSSVQQLSRWFWPARMHPEGEHCLCGLALMRLRLQRACRPAVCRRPKWWSHVCAAPWTALGLS